MIRPTDLTQNTYSNTQNDEEPNYQIYEGETGNFGLNPQRSQFTRTQGLKSKVVTKEIKEQAKALENRINLLKTQEENMLKKIEKTQEQAKKMMKVKQRNKEKQQLRNKLEEKRKRELEEKKERVRKAKEERRRRLMNVKQGAILENRSKVLNVRKGLSKLKKRHKEEAKEQQIQKMQTRNRIKKLEQSVSERKENHLKSVKNAAKNRKFFEIARNEKNVGQLGEKIEKLEGREKELMARLMETQAKHNEARKELKEFESIKE